MFTLRLSALSKRGNLFLIHTVMCWKNLKQGCAEDVIVTPKVKAAQLLTRQIQSPTVRV